MPDTPASQSSLGADRWAGWISIISGASCAAAAARIASQGSVPAPGGRWRSSCRGSIEGPPSPPSRAPRLSCTWNSRTASSTGSTSVASLDAHVAGDDVRVPDVEQHPVRAAVEPVDEVADRQRVVADARAPGIDRAQVLEAHGHAERLGRSGRGAAARAPPRPTRGPAARSRARGRRRGVAPIWCVYSSRPSKAR